MTFDEILEQVLDILRRRGRVSYRGLKRQFGLDNAYLADLQTEIVEVHRTGLVIVGEVGAASRHEQLALGETQNLAAPGTVAISAALLEELA